MLQAIQDSLRKIEEEHDVRVLFACESGSRAWGFASTDSDYDVRFIYAHQPEWYMAIDQERDVIEKQLPGDLDVSGWELRKALRLFRKSNPPMLDWLRSPIIYSQDEKFVEHLRSVKWEPQVSKELWGFSPLRCLEHYYSMARGNIRNYFDREEVPLKKYLYVVRPLLACMWIEEKGSLPPVSFDDLVGSIVRDEELRDAIDKLVTSKKSGTELGTGPKIEAIHRFVDAQMSRLAASTALPDSLAATRDLDDLFRRTVGFSTG